MTYRFVHAADIHLDSPLKSLSLRDAALAKLIGNATRQAFVTIVDLCLTEQVDALLLAGDLYDGEQTSMKTALFLGEQMRRLHEAGIRVFIIRGNHDALSKITQELTFPDSVKIFRGHAEAIVVERVKTAFPVAIHGLSFAKPHAPDSLLDKYRMPIEGAVNIGLMHTSLDGSPGHDSYAPCSLADLQASGFRYWALGHIHKRSVAEGRCTVVMPGMPQGRDINEAGLKSVTLITVADDRSITLEEYPTSIAQFERLAIDATGINATGINDWRDLVAAVGKTLDRVRSDIDTDHIVVRLRVSGATPLAWRIRNDSDLLKLEAMERGKAAGKVWIDRVEVDCSAPGDENRSSADPLTELRRLIAQDVSGSEAYQAAMTEIAEELRGYLPPECRRILGSDDASLRQTVSALMPAATDDVLARLHKMTKPGES